MTTAVTPSAWKASHSHSHSHSTSHSQSASRSSRPSTTPRPNHPVASPSTQTRTPLSSNIRTPHLTKDMKTPSPSYFGFVVGDDSIPGESGPGPHARQNWIDSTRVGARPSNSDRSPEFELFRRQSEKNIAFALNGLPQSQSQSQSQPQPHVNSIGAAGWQDEKNVPISPKSAGPRDSERQSDRSNPKGVQSESNTFFLGIQRHDSPLPLSPRNSVLSDRQPRLSLPASDMYASLAASGVQRSDTLPLHTTEEVHAMVSPPDVAKILEQYPEQCIVLDLRVYPQYAAARLRGALNLCIPTTLLKRPAFTVQKLADTLTSEEDRAKFSKWKDSKYIIAYDATSSLAKEATTSFHVLKKFNTEGWKGHGYVIKGGFAGLQKSVPRLIDQGSKLSAAKPGGVSLPSSTNMPKLPVAGGCAMPATKNAANPFFGNIRQNMDLLDGVGQIPIKRPTGARDSEEKKLPSWLKRAASSSNEGKDVSNKFLKIEKAEQMRMQNALSGSVSYGTPGADREAKSKNIQVAGIEKGSKNRYNNIFPFEHSRVRLQDVPAHGCDYVNASFVKAGFSNRKYIATQAPIPQTFDDFWRVVWEQDVRVIVMLTAESEGGQVKSHAYWKTGEYGPHKVTLLAEKKVMLTSHAASSITEPARRTGSERRLTASNATPAVEKQFNFKPATSEQSNKQVEEASMVFVRQFSVTNTVNASLSPRTITQVQYTQWPDFGAPASATAILNLIEVVDECQRRATTPANASSPSEPAKESQKPIMVHCSAGCGRTGTFCTIDSVIDMLKRQRMDGENSADAMDVDSQYEWVKQDDIDLVAKAVEDFRFQRLSMVQNLRQFVLCYESILQWLHDHSDSN